MEQAVLPMMAFLNYLTAEGSSNNLILIEYDGSRDGVGKVKE